jgi:hypothetical protein
MKNSGERIVAVPPPMTTVHAQYLHSIQHGHC